MKKRVTALWTLGIIIICLTGFSVFKELTVSKEKNVGWNAEQFSTSDLSEKHINSVVIDKDQRVWVGLKYECSIYIFENGSWATLDLNDIIPSGCEYNISVAINSITFDSLDRAWIGTKNSGILIIDGDKHEIYNTENSGLPTNYINKIAFSQDNEAWILSLPEQFSPPYISSLIKFDGQEWIPVIESEETDDWHLLDFSFDHLGKLWVVASGLGLIQIDDDQWTEYTPENSGLETAGIELINFDDEGNAWISTNEESINVFDGVSWSVLPLIGDFANQIDFDSQGRAWIGTFQGLQVYDGTNWVEYTSSNSGLASNEITSIVIDDENNVWVGTWEGLSVVSGDLPAPLSPDKARQYSSNIVLNNFWGILILLIMLWVLIFFLEKIKSIKIIFNKRTLLWSIFLVFFASILFGSGTYELTSMYPGPSLIDFLIAPFKGFYFVVTDMLALILVGMGLVGTLVAMIFFGGLGAVLGKIFGNSIKGSVIGIWISVIPGTLSVLLTLGGWN